MAVWLASRPGKLSAVAGQLQNCRITGTGPEPCRPDEIKLQGRAAQVSPSLPSCASLRHAFCCLT
jgi:hypothetical protein